MHMIFATPPISPAVQRRLDKLDKLWQKLGRSSASSSTWLGSLRRSVRESNIAASTSIEGFSVTPSETSSAIAATGFSDQGSVDRMAVACYARAMDHVAVLENDPQFRWLDRVILDLHFDACYFQRDKSPGRYREIPIAVTGSGGGIDYTAPDADSVPEMMAEVVDWLAGDDGTHAAIRAAMAHLHLVSIHPFRDGNGRISRLSQSLVLARSGLTSPEFNSIEDYLGSHTAEYYDVLRRTQGGSYQPERDATGWVEFCLDAHISQAGKRLAQINVAARRWQFLSDLVDGRGWPDRFVIALEQALMDRADRASYATEADISAASASSDFRRLLDAGLLDQSGRGRGTHYTASEQLRKGLG